MEKTEVENNSKAREAFIVGIIAAIEHLEMDRGNEFEKEFCKAISSYSLPEIYENIDIELASKLKGFDDTLSLEKRTKFSKEISKIAKELAKEDLNVPHWLREYTKLIFTSHNINDPYRIIKLRKLQESSNKVEIDLILAGALVQEGIRKIEGNCFIESEAILNSIEPILDGNEELPKRYRYHFPKDPQETFALLRVWWAQNFAAYFQQNERISDAIKILEETLKQKWVRVSGEAGKLQMDLSLLKVIEKAVKMITDERITNEKKLQDTASNLETKWTTVLGVFLAASFLAPMLSGMVSHLGFDELKKIIPVIALSTILIVNFCFIFVCREWKKLCLLLLCASLIIGLISLLII
jgi:hypothetical protein